MGSNRDGDEPVSGDLVRREEGRVPVVRALFATLSRLPFKNFWQRKKIASMREVIKKEKGFADDFVDHQRGYVARARQMIDATFVEVARQRNSREENAKIKAGEIPEGWDDASIQQDCRELAVSLTNQLAHVFQKRDSVELMILSVDGEMLCYNASASGIILTDQIVDKHLADIRGQLGTNDLNKDRLRCAGSSSSKTAIVQLLVSQGTSWYGLRRGFLLEAPLDLEGVVIEQISLRRLDMYQLYDLSPREIPVISALAAGKTGRSPSDWYLTPREISVITALAAGKTDKEIAMTLDVSPETVRWYLKSIRNKEISYAPTFRRGGREFWRPTTPRQQRF